MNQWEEWWSLYPKKVCKKQVKAVWDKQKKEPQYFIDQLKLQIKVYEQNESKGIWQPNWKDPVRWFRHGAYENTPEVKKTYHVKVHKAKKGLTREKKDKFGAMLKEVR